MVWLLWRPCLRRRASGSVTYRKASRKISSAADWSIRTMLASNGSGVESMRCLTSPCSSPWRVSVGARRSPVPVGIGSNGLNLSVASRVESDRVLCERRRHCLGILYHYVHALCESGDNPEIFKVGAHPELSVSPSITHQLLVAQPLCKRLGSRRSGAVTPRICYTRLCSVRPG